MTPTKAWPHAPIHRINSDGIYMVTGATLRKVHLFNTTEKLSLVENDLLSLAKQYQWHLEAWAVLLITTISSLVVIQMRHASTHFSNS